MGRKKGSKNKKVEKVTTEVLPPVYKVTLKLLGREYKAEGNTIDEVLNNLQPGGWAKGAGVLIVEHDGMVREKIIAGNHIRNIFGLASGTMREVSLKWVRQLFE